MSRRVLGILWVPSPPSNGSEELFTNERFPIIDLVTSRLLPSLAMLQTRLRRIRRGWDGPGRGQVRVQAGIQEGVNSLSTVQRAA